MKTKEYKVTMSGSLKEIDIADIFQLLASTQKTGILRIKTKWGEGCVYFKRGVINHADFGNKENPKDTVFNLIGLNQGTFEFQICDGDNPDFKNTINMQVPFILMEAAKREDELDIDIDIDED